MVERGIKRIKTENIRKTSEKKTKGENKEQKQQERE